MIRIEGLSQTYKGREELFNNLNLKVEEGEFLSLIGSSGSGKSTILNIIEGIVKPQAGLVQVLGQDMAKIGAKELRRLRRDISYIFQDYNLVGPASLIENVLYSRLGYKSKLDSLLARFSQAEYERALEILKELGLEDKAFQRAGDLSGGEKQRLAIARAICQDSRLILADEPVASLDIKNSHLIMKEFKRLNDRGITMVISLHDVDLAKEYSKRIVALREGRIVFDASPGELDGSKIEEIYK